MALSTIKSEFAKQHIAFGKGGNGKAIGERDDIDELAIIAQQSGNRNLLKLFDKLPSVEELQKAKTDSQLPKKAAQAEAPKATEPTK
jgi:hypothetical protein